MSGVLAMIAGAGDLPVDLATRMAADGKPYFILRITGLADTQLDAHPGVTLPIGSFGAFTRRMRSEGVDRMFFAGKVARPRWNRFGIDWMGLKALARLLLRAWWGDDALQRAVASQFERQGFHVVSPAEVWPDLLMPAGLVAGRFLSDADWSDIRIAAAAAHAVGRKDRGQGAVARGGRLLGTEDRGHTDALVALAAGRPGEGGVLVKLAKPQQDMRLDLPVVGPDTIRAAAAAHLAGVVIEAGGALLTRREETLAEATRTGVFLYGLRPQELTA